MALRASVKSSAEKKKKRERKKPPEKKREKSKAARTLREKRGDVICERARFVPRPLLSSFPALQAVERERKAPPEIERASAASKAGPHGAILIAFHSSKNA